MSNGGTEIPGFCVDSVDEVGSDDGILPIMSIGVGSENDSWAVSSLESARESRLGQGCEVVIPAGFNRRRLE